RFLPRYTLVDRCTAPLVDWFLYMSAAIREHCREGIGPAATRGEICYDPFDFAAFDRAAGSVSRVRAELGLAGDDILITNVGRLIPWKGQDYFIDALAEVVREEPRVKALLVGDAGPTRQSREFEESLRQRVADRQLQDHVIFTGFRADVPGVMAASDVVVHSSCDPEPFGRVIVEAMAARRPVVATAAGGVPEIVEDGRTGLLVPLRDARAMADAIRQLICNPEAARSMGERARTDAEARFGAALFAHALHRAYRHAFAMRGAADS
ncbi:MAG: glycosyltransferase family 4 protein, partial [Longimicrobiales bacterium]